MEMEPAALGGCDWQSCARARLGKSAVPPTLVPAAPTGGVVIVRNQLASSQRVIVTKLISWEDVN